MAKWSVQGLSETGWAFWDKCSHGLYLTRGKEGERFLIKLYWKSGNRLWGRDNKAKREFHNTLLAHGKGFRTVLPVAWGEGWGKEGIGVIVYPFVDGAISLERAYSYREPSCLSVRERQEMEKQVGQLLRLCLDSGLFPVNMCLGHFLGCRDSSGRLVVYWVDFEKMKFRVGFRSKTMVKTLAKLLARMEWFRASGGKMGRSSIMRIGYPSVCRRNTAKANRDLCCQVVAAARKYWNHREIEGRGSYPANRLEPVGTELS